MNAVITPVHTLGANIRTSPHADGDANVLTTISKAKPVIVVNIVYEGSWLSFDIVHKGIVRRGYVLRSVVTIEPYQHEHMPDKIRAVFVDLPHFTMHAERPVLENVLMLLQNAIAEGKDKGMAEEIELLSALAKAIEVALQ
jgi:hypothetical protein